MRATARHLQGGLAAARMVAAPSMLIASCTLVFVVCTVLAGLKVLSMCSLSTISIQLAGEILYELLPNPQFELVRHDICFPL